MGSRHLAGLGLALLLGACGEPEPRYAGSAACATCHRDQADAWGRSQHARAMMPADAASVAADFAVSAPDHFGVASEFSRQGDRYWVRTEGRDGSRDEFEIAYTFGVEPLQQYLVSFPDGRLQALGVAWDTRPRAHGGQRWFHLHPGERIPPGDVLHWTARGANWNTMCAECHSTNVRRGYDPEADRYDTTWSEVSVGCEACHGPGARHIRWAEDREVGVERAGLEVDLRDDVTWRFAPDAAIAAPSRVRRERPELDVCAPCHARRSRIAPQPEPGEPFLDGYHPALLDGDLYYADGQIREEVYVWGSFLQSRMHAAGVTCGDCHDPHDPSIRSDPDQVCAGCHRVETFAAAAHHGHPEASAGASCVACHMPARTYMVVDARRDHSFRIPRPGLSSAVGAPDACRGCHSEASPDWIRAAWRKRWGDGGAGVDHYGRALHAGRRSASDAVERLAQLVRDPAAPAIARATALSQLARLAPEPPLIATAAADPDPLLRLAAAGALENLDPGHAATLGGPLLRDERRAVRIEAARALAPQLGREALALRGDLESALAEYRESQRIHADRPSARTNLGLLAARQGDWASAEREYTAALRLEPRFVPAAVNLADVFRTQGREAEAERVLRTALDTSPASADLRHALGLCLVRRGERGAALAELERAAQLDPEEPRYSYVWALALQEAGQRAKALRVLRQALARHPGHAEIRAAARAFANPP